mmetsp:Transcript_15755/g.39619  ORF Transcript_15755/g.39619 Transcript_15755/m.39619 type:complete len:93 (+) Transcript_15755:705-983(+)
MNLFGKFWMKPTSVERIRELFLQIAVIFKTHCYSNQIRRNVVAEGKVQLVVMSQQRVRADECEIRTQRRSFGHVQNIIERPLAYVWTQMYRK